VGLDGGGCYNKEWDNKQQQKWIRKNAIKNQIFFFFFFKNSIIFINNSFGRVVITNRV